MATDENDPHGTQAGPEEGATEVARVLHGDNARAERYEQPENVVTLPGDTHVAEPGRDKTQSDAAADEGRAPKR